MAFWWVNQKHTHKEEVGGNFLWSPKTKHNKAGAPIKNRSYDYMTEVRSGDILFGYWEKAIRVVAVATGEAVSWPRPPGFDVPDFEWGKDGWRLPVEFSKLEEPIDPRAYAARIKPLLPRGKSEYSPLHPDTLAGQRFLYLASVPEELGRILLDLTGRRSSTEKAARLAAAAAATPELDELENAVEETLGHPGKKAGRRQSPDERAAIEKHAMAAAAAFLSSSEGGDWHVSDVSRGNPYDLLCSKGKLLRLRVEVKGTTSTGEVVGLTRNEVKHVGRHSPRVALIVVHGITLSRAPVRASGGTLTFIDGWKIAGEDLEPIAYRYRVPLGAARAVVPVAQHQEAGEMRSLEPERVAKI